MVETSWDWEDLWRRRRPTPGVLSAQPKGFAGVRLSPKEAEASLEYAADRLALPRSGRHEDFNLLALSGGAAGGAYGAGALVGLSQIGQRQDFSVVTGVSTGALIAPFAFLGEAWDERLEDAYTGGHAAERFRLTAMSGVLDGGLLGADSLDGLIAPFVDERLLDAIALQHRSGRRLLVATTDLDRQRPAIWDMGAIAERGGPEAVAMFRLVLAASASLPGVFVPRLVRCELDGQEFDELHVDGGVTAPLFIVPEPMLRWRRLGRRLRRGSVFAIINTVLEPSAQTTALSLPAVLTRSFDTMLRVSYRQALSAAATFCVSNNIPLKVASIPPSNTEAGGYMLDFDTETMRASFERGREAAKSERFWATPSVRLEPWEAVLELLRP